MRDYAKIAPTFWTGDTGRQLRGDPLAVSVALYLMSCPSANMIGLYYLPIQVLAHEIGSPFEGASKALRRVCEVGFASYDPSSELVFVPEMARYQVGESLSRNDKRIKGIERELLKYKKHRFFADFLHRYRDAYHLRIDPPEEPLRSPFEAPSKPLRSQDQDQDQEQEQDFVCAAPAAPPPETGPGGKRRRAPARPPTRCPSSDAPEAELGSWLQAHDIPDGDPELPAFLDYHRAKGTTSKDWAASWRTWMRNAARFSRGPLPSAARPPRVQPQAARPLWVVPEPKEAP